MRFGYNTDAIQAVVEGILKRGNTKQALVVNAKVRVNTDGNPRTSDVLVGVTFVFFAPRSYVTVACALHDQWFNGPLVEQLKDLQWHCYSKHSSCWRTDGMRIPYEIYEAVMGNAGHSPDHIIDYVENLDLSECVFDNNKSGLSFTVNKMAIFEISEIGDLMIKDCNDQVISVFENYNYWYYEGVS